MRYGRLAKKMERSLKSSQQTFLDGAADGLINKYVILLATERTVKPDCNRIIPDVALQNAESLSVEIRGIKVTARIYDLCHLK